MKYYVIFVDDHTKYTWLYPLRKKSDFFTIFVNFQRLMENQFDKKIKKIRCDGGGEFSSQHNVEFKGKFHAHIHLRKMA